MTPSRSVVVQRCENCGRAVAAGEMHPAPEITATAGALCADCWFDAGKE